MVSVIWCHHALPIYWNVLEKKGASNLGEQKAVIRPVLKLLNNYKIILIGDREFHRVKLADWIEKEKKRTKQEIYLAFRQKQGTYFQKRGNNYQKLSEIEIIPGVKQFQMGIKITKKKGFGKKNIAIYQKRKHKGKSHDEPWYILTNLTEISEVLKVYSQRSGIEAMFKDCKTGGDNLEGTKANTNRLTNIILLIAIAYTNRAIIGEKLKNKGKQKYLARRSEKRRKTRRHSEFWLGLYGELWCNNYEFYVEEINQIMQLNKNKLTFYQKGLQAMSEIKKVY